jgi:predicted ATP-dependent Lon-type protease
MEMDALDNKSAKAFDGYLVRKDLVRQFSRQYPVPTYVVEFLLGRYCASVDATEIQEGLAIVERQLASRTVKAGEEELFKARAREQGSVKVIDIISARLDAKSDSYLATLPSLRLKDARIEPELVRQNERMLNELLVIKAGEELAGQVAAGQVLKVKIEVDTDPPLGFTKTTRHSHRTTCRQFYFSVMVSGVFFSIA